ncbi:MAG: 30S ribosomal protein S15 [Cyanobacteria bacterium P01_H01_bin.74]
MAQPQKQKEFIQPFAQNEKDTGSSVVQIAALTHKIRELTEHLKKNPKDFSCQRGLQMMVGSRKRLLRYIKSKITVDAYQALIKRLGIRR